MGTRGAIGFRINNMDKVTYNHFDSYPTGLGVSVIKFIKGTDNDTLKAIAEKIVLVNQGDEPTNEQILECRPYLNKSVSNNTEKDWYCLLREAQGDFEVYKGDLKYMIDSHDFLMDSLFCEWAYIINLDNGTLEIYEGFNKGENTNGRYALKPKNTHNDSRDTKYYGVGLINTIPLDEVRLIEDVNKYCHDLEVDKEEVVS